MNLENLENLVRQRALSDFPELRLVYLFGSQVTGKTGPQSDYDLAVMLDRSGDIAPRRAALEHLLGAGLETQRLDVVWLSQAPVDLAFAIISQGAAYL
jgi:predicted nucleotidyltransferase